MECPRCHKENDEDSRYCASCGTTLGGELPAGGTLTLFAPPDKFATGSFFAGRYRIIEEIGHGGMGNVYKAFDTKVGEKIALKIIRPEIARDRTSIERFRNELKLARQITHPHVCRVFDLGEDAGTPFLTMEFVPGENLALMLRMTGALPPETAVGYARQIAQGLAAAHRLGVIHRDLKPHNVLIDESGTAKIMDFGIARSVLGGTSADDGKMIGTPDYMAPEQAAGNPADARADIYALGVILYEMVAGRRPFAGDTPRDLVLKHRTEPPRPPLELNDRVSVGLNELILKCLAKDPADRYQTADELLAALDGLALAPSAAIPGPRDRRRPIGRRMIGIGMAAAALLLIAAAVVFHGLPIGAPKSPPDPLEAEAFKRLAVLPLANKSPQRDQDWFVEGLTDDIRTKLGAADPIQMIAKMSCEQMRDSAKGLRAKGIALQARHILYGDCSIEGNKLRVYVFLGDAATDNESWNKSFEDSLDNFSKVTDRIASEVAQQLRVQLSPDRMQGIKRRDPVNVEAYRSFLLGQLYERQYRHDANEANYLKSEQSYLRATELDPRYALAYCGLGNLAEAQYVKTGPQSLALMRRRFQQALDLDSHLAEAQIGLGLTCLYADDPEQASRFIRSALASGADNADVVYGVGAFLRSVGLYDRALVHFLKAAELDRLNPTPGFNAASCCWYLGRYDEAEALLRKVIAIEPGNYKNYLNLARQMLMLSKPEEAEKEIALADKVAPAVPAAASFIHRHLAWLAAVRGEKDKALALLKDEKTKFRYEVTNVYCLLGLTDEALVQMENGYRSGFQEFKDFQYTFLYLERNPLLKLVRDDPRFLRLLAQARTDYERWTRLCGDL